MELALEHWARRPRGLTPMVGTPHVFTIARIAENKDWLHELSLALDPEDGHLWATMPESSKSPR